LFLEKPHYFESLFEKEVTEDERIEKLLFMNSDYPRADDDNFIIGLELKGGGRIAGEIEGSIHNFYSITEIDKYKVEVLALKYMISNGERWYRNTIVYKKELRYYFLEDKLGKSFENLNDFIDNYDEIKVLIEKIYNEGAIPGSYDETGKDASKWGEEEKLNFFHFD